MAVDRPFGDNRCAAACGQDAAPNVYYLRSRRPAPTPVMQLSRHCHACLADGYLVFLDLRHGAYCGLPPHQARAALALIDCDAALQAECLPAGRLEPEVVQELLDNGVVTTDPRRGKQMVTLETVRATHEAMGSGDLRPPRVSLREAWHFLMALTSSAVLFALLPLRALAWLERQRPRRRARRADVPAAELNRLADLFFYLAPLFYSQKDRCLFNSLVLKRFLRRHGIEARWVFGVAADPFEAHCWIQAGDTAVGDSLTRIWRLTPIMVL